MERCGGKNRGWATRCRGYSPPLGFQVMHCCRSPNQTPGPNPSPKALDEVLAMALERCPEPTLLEPVVLDRILSGMTRYV